MRNVAARVLAGLALAATAAIVPSVGSADAAPAPVSVLPTKIAFGKVHYGRSVTKTLNVKIAAGWALSSVDSSGDFPTGTPVNCGPGSQTCKIPQTFAPSELGLQGGQTTIYVCRISDGLCDRAGVSLSGTGTAPVQFLPGKVAFGNVKVGKTASKKVNLTIDDGFYLNSQYEEEPFTTGANNCVGQPKCSTTAYFSPLVVGAQSGVLVFKICPSGGPNVLPCIDIPLPATGTGVAPVKFLPSKLSFGSVPVGGTKSLKVNLNIDSGWYLNSGLDDGDFAYGDSTCVGQPHCTVTATFSPSNLGAETGQLLFRMCRSGAPNNPPPSCVDVYLPAAGKGI